MIPRPALSHAMPRAVQPYSQVVLKHHLAAQVLVALHHRLGCGRQCLVVRLAVQLHRLGRVVGGRVRQPQRLQGEGAEVVGGWLLNVPMGGCDGRCEVITGAARLESTHESTPGSASFFPSIANCSRSPMPPPTDLRDALCAKQLDPVLGCVAAHVRPRALQRPACECRVAMEVHNVL